MSQSTSQFRRGVAAAGSWIVDHVKLIDAWPPQDSVALIAGYSHGNGGSAYNLLKDLAKLECGFPLKGMGLIGDDSDGEWILNDCRECGIDSTSLRRDPAAVTSFTDVMTVQSSGRRTFFHHLGANAALSEKHLDLAACGARIFHLGYLALLKELDVLDNAGRNGASRLFERAGQLGMLTTADLVSLPTGEFATVIDPSLPYLDYLFLNEFEAARLLGKPLREIEGGVSVSWLVEAAGQILKRGVRQAVIMHTPPGAVCVSRGNGSFTQGSVKMPPGEIRGTTGAGDAFCAGCMLGIHEGWKIPDFLELAVCVAATSLRDATCSDSIRPWQECLRDGRSHGFADF